VSKGVTHTTIADDCARVVEHASGVCIRVRAALRAHPETARLGGITRHGDRHTPSLLHSLREHWPGEALAWAPEQGATR